MERSKYLYNLVHALTRQEKRYLKVFAGTYSHSENKNYLKLFDAIGQQTEYDEEALKKRFEGEAFVKQFPVAKNYLHNLIIRNMLNYSSANNVRFRLRNQFSEIAFLHDKGLLAECRKAMRRTRKMAYEYEEYLFLLELLTWEMEMFRIDFDMDMVEEYARKEDELLLKIYNYVQYRRLKVMMFGLYKKHFVIRKTQDRKALESLMKHPLLKNESLALTTDARASFHFIYGFYHRILGDSEASFRSRARQVAVIEESPGFIAVYPEEYVIALNNVLSVCREIRDHEVFYSYRDRLRNICSIVKGEIGGFLNALVRVTLLVHEPAYCYKVGKVQEGIAAVEAGEKHLVALADRVSDIRMLYIYFSFMRLYVSAGDYHKALHWLNRIMNNFTEKIFPDYIVLCRFMQLIIHYELGNTYILESLIRSTYRYLYKRRRLYKAETLILEFLRSLTKVNTREDLLSRFSALNRAFTRLKKDAFENNFFTLFDLDAWLESKIQNRPFANIMQERSRRA